MEDLYELLQVRYDASKEVINSAYKALARMYHPDTSNHIGSEASLEKMKRLNNAREILCDDELRAKYDEELKKSQDFKAESFTSSQANNSGSADVPPKPSNQNSSSDASEANERNKSHKKVIRNWILLILTAIIIYIILNTSMQTYSMKEAKIKAEAVVMQKEILILNQELLKLDGYIDYQQFIIETEKENIKGYNKELKSGKISNDTYVEITDIKNDSWKEIYKYVAGYNYTKPLRDAAKEKLSATIAEFEKQFAGKYVIDYLQ